jgi:hypothetical protein
LLWKKGVGCPEPGERVRRPRGKAMTFDEVLGQVKELLQQQKRTSYRGLKRRFDLVVGHRDFDRLRRS